MVIQYSGYTVAGTACVLVASISKHTAVVDFRTPVYQVLRALCIVCLLYTSPVRLHEGILHTADQSVNGSILHINRGIIVNLT